MKGTMKTKEGVKGMDEDEGKRRGDDGERGEVEGTEENEGKRRGDDRERGKDEGY